MIAVTQALFLIDRNVKANNFCELKITDALGCVLAEDVTSSMDLPPFRQSAMDGFAVCSWDHKEFTIKGEIQAGSSEEISLRPGEAVRIYTGARVPLDADRVIMKEHVEDLQSHIHVIKHQERANIKHQGEHVKRGKMVLLKGTELNTAALSFLAGLGIDKIKVNKKPKVAVLISGNELLQPGDHWEQAKSYDSNSYILKLLLKKAGVDQVSLYYVKDDVQTCVSMVGELLESYDFIVASGGISVGDYDLMREAFSANHIVQQFYKINQKPGKPIYFGLKND